MGQQVLSGFRPQDNYSRDLVSQFDVAARANAEARFNAPAAGGEGGAAGILAGVLGIDEVKQDIVVTDSGSLLNLTPILLARKRRSWSKILRVFSHML